jgi:hypothetical protein
MLINFLADATPSSLAEHGNIMKFLYLAIPLDRLRTISQGMMIVFQTVAFPLVVYGMAKQLVASGRANSTGLWTVGKTIIVVACIAAASWFVTMADTLVSYGMNTEFEFADIGSRSGTSAMVLQPNYDQLCNKIAFLGSNIQGKAGDGTSYTDYSVWNPWRYFKQTGQAVSNAADKFNPEYWCAVAITYAMALVGGLAILIMQALLLVQQAIVILSTCILPVFIAFLAMGEAQAGIGMNFIRSVWGVLCWPIGWGIVNIGAQAGISVLSTSTDGGILSGLALLLQFSLIGLWIIVGTVVVPFAVQHAITKGTNMASQMVLATAGMAAGGAAMLGGKVGGAIGGVAGGGGARGALMGGTKGAIVGGLAGGPVGALAGGAVGAGVGAIPMGGSGNGRAVGKAAGSLPGKLIALSTERAGQVD